MSAEITSIFRPDSRLNHVEHVALPGQLKVGTFDTRDFGEVTITRGDRSRPGFMAKSEGFNVSVSVGPDGGLAAILTFDMNPIETTSAEQVASLREQADKMLKQCNRVTRR